MASIHKLSEQHQGFFALVYQVVEQIPQGRVTTYGAIARYLGTGLSARMVGWAMNAAHSLPHIPAHRVVNRLGILSGKHHFGAPDEMELRLQVEGVVVKHDRVLEFDSRFWDPALHLSLDS